MQCVSASKPVAALIAGGSPRVSSGSRMAHFGKSWGAKITVLRPVDFTGEHAGASDFAAGATGGRQRDHRRHVPGDVHAAIDAVVELLPGTRGLGAHRDELGAVDGRASTDGHDAVGSVGRKGLRARLDISFRRVGRHPGKHRELDAGEGQGLLHRRGKAQREHRGIGDQERATDTGKARLVAHPGGLSCTEDDSSGEAPNGRHQITSK